jgi:E3 ubiquitin-protein ligase HERC2
MYVRGLITPQMLVRCCMDFEEIRKGDVGTVLKVEPEGLHDLNVRVDWQMHDRPYWMCFVHLELLEPPPPPVPSHSGSDPQQSLTPQPIVVGSLVKLRPIYHQHQRFRYATTSLPRGSVGVVQSISGSEVIVDFPQQSCWLSQMSDLELVPQQPGGGQANQNTINYDIIEDWSRCIRSLTVSSNECQAKYLLTRSSNYWQSSSTTQGSSSKHWIRLEMHDNVLIQSLSITVDPDDCSHMPSLVFVRVGDTMATLKEFNWVSINPTDTNVTLLSDLKQFYPWIEIVVKQCRNNGIQCRIHGLQVIGRRRQTDLDLMLQNAAFLATESDQLCEPSFSMSSSSTALSYAEEKQQHASNSSQDIQSKVLVWGLNDKEQLGGLKGSKVKLPTFSSVLSSLKPIHIAGGSKSLFIVSQDGKLYACGEGTNGRLGLGHNNNVPTPRQVPIVSQYVVKKVAVHSGGKHALALTLDGKVFSWGEGEFKCVFFV